MARNRNKYRKRVRAAQHRVEGRVFPGALAALMVIATIACLSYLWMCGRVEDLGRTIKDLEQQKVALDRRVVNEEYKWSNLTSPESMEKLLRRHGLNMILPREQSVVRLRREVLVPPQIRTVQLAQEVGRIAHD